MTVLVVMMSYNPFTLGRVDVLEKCWGSLPGAFPDAKHVLVGNGCSDGSEGFLSELAQSVGGEFLSFDFVGEGQHTPGHGRNSIVRWLKKRGLGENVLVMSDDDMFWKEGSQEKLMSLWAAAPDNLFIVSGLLEPVWHWNTPRETITCGDVPVLLRDSCPGAGWTMSRRVFDLLNDHPFKDDFGYDYQFCLEIGKSQRKVGQIDLAEHLGWFRSTHGNDAIANMEPLDREKWKI